MTPKLMAYELFEKYYQIGKNHDFYFAKECSLLAVDYIINSNPHSNPFNTEVYSTFSYWQEVKQEILNL